MAKQKEKVDWKKQYQLDNVFNLIMWILSMFFFALTLGLDGLYEKEFAICTLIFMVVGFYVNLEASYFFRGDRYQ